MSVVGVYVPRDTWVHRAPAGAKTLTLIVVVTAVVLVENPWFLGACVVGALALYLVARLGLALVLRVVRPLALFLAVLVLFQGFFAGWDVAALVGTRLTVMVLLGALLSLTTPVSAMLAMFERVLRPLRGLGVASDRAALVLALAIRAIPMAAQAWRRSREAYLARGAAPAAAPARGPGDRGVDSFGRGHGRGDGGPGRGLVRPVPHRSGRRRRGHGVSPRLPGSGAKDPDTACTGLTFRVPRIQDNTVRTTWSFRTHGRYACGSLLPCLLSRVVCVVPSATKSTCPAPPCATPIGVDPLLLWRPRGYSRSRPGGTGGVR
ncbi:energy-coupling factor transporter transmembrane component T family protein [Spiractinospora alimapuensis]|uniref:energy-coupling factor transporter transmembrane component T family protein n=1 Tax=Spiractinospora alimapuensis TaxID=2820884 RepID=UPI002ED3541D